MDWTRSAAPADTLSFRFQQTSPLSTLVRQTSSSHRRAREYVPYTPSPQSQPTDFVTAPSIQQPPSPLLHSHFRGSTVTSYSKDYSSYLDTSGTTFEEGVDAEHNYHDRESIYSNITVFPPSPTTGFRESLQPSNGLNEGAASVGLNQITGTNEGSPIVPTVVISSPDSGAGNVSSVHGRAEIIAPTAANFSRPVRRPPPTSDSQKLQVLERNSRRLPWPLTPSEYSQKHQAVITSRNQSSTIPNPNRANSPSLSNNGNHAPPTTSNLKPPLTPSIVIFSDPPSQASPAASVYSNNSFRRDKTSSSPPEVSSTFPDMKQNGSVTNSPLAIAPAHSLKTAYDYLLLGIQYHEANRLKDSASCFEMSAKQQGGCGVGMLMWGLTLRHGWGCEKNEKQGFKWLQKAAESAVGDLESTRGGVEATAVQTELVLAIYEVGHCFFHGWGVARDRVMAVSYYTVAARLGDADAQQNLAFCLANGKGCKKDKREAAKWHRAAVAQGASDVGLAWIYKEKYQ